MKKIFVFLTMCCLMIGAFAQTAPVAKAVKNPGDTIDCSSFKAAVDTLNASGHGGTILVCADDSIADLIMIEKPMTIKAFGDNYTIKVANSFNADKAFLIKKNLILGEDGAEYTLTFDGNRKTPQGAFFYCSNPYTDDPKLTFEDGVHITKCSSTVACMGSECELNIIGDILVDECTCDHLFYTWFPNMLTMTNGKIENNTVTTCIFEINGDAQLSGGAIQNNTYTGANASAIISYYSHLDVYTDNSNVKLQDSIFIGDTVRLIAGNNFRDQLETGNELTKHSADNPIVVKVNYTEDRQILTGDTAKIIANYTKFKPVDVNGKNVCIDKEGWLREYKFFSIATGTTDTVGHFTLKAAVDTLNNHGGGKVLADYGEVLTETVNVNSDIQILARGADVTFTRGDDLANNFLISVSAESLTIGESKDDLYTITFDGNNIETPASLLDNNAILQLNGKVLVQNNRGFSAITNNGGRLLINGEAHFENNIAENGGAIYNNSGETYIQEGAIVVFERDSAVNGGAIYNMEGGMFVAPNTEVRFVDNRAGENGGAIYLLGEAQVQSENAAISFEGNSAQNGGAIYLKYDLSISNTAFNFVNNRATGNGGAIYIDEHSLDFNYALVTFDGDSATNGGAIYNDEGKIHVFSSTSVPVTFTGNKATNGGAVYNYISATTNIASESKVDFDGNIATDNGGAVYNGSYCTLNIDEESVLHCHNNQAQYGAAIYNDGRVESNGTMNIEGNIATRGGVIINTEDFFTYTSGSITNNVVKYTAGDDNQSDNGVVVVKGGGINLNGGTIKDNIFVNESGRVMDTLPASLVYDASKTGTQQIRLSDSIFVDTVRLLLRGDYEKNIFITNDLTVASEENPIVLIVDTLDKQIMDNGYATNYKKFKPAADTLDVNNQGWLVRKPQISVDGIYLLQANTLYEDYGITTASGNVDEDKIYVEYTQNVDARGSDNITTSDSTIIEMTVTAGEAVSNLRQKIADSRINGRYGFAVPFSSAALSGVDLTSGTYTVKIDTLIVYTLGISAGTEETLEKDVNIPTFSIDTLNFLLAGTKFSDFGYCGVGASTNDGDGDDVVPGDEIYVQYQREGAIDTAYITVVVTGNGQTVTYKENTPANTHLEAGCGSFRSFLDNTGIGQFEPNALQLVDDSIYTCQVGIRVKAEGDPYFTTANKTFTYKHDIDRAAVFALDTANDRDENYNKIGIALNNINDSLALTYPSVFSVAKANELGMIDNTDHCVYVVLTADPVDTVLRVESANQAKNLLDDVALNNSNYSTAGYGIQDGKLLMAVKVSEPVAENAVVVPAINFVTDSVLRWCSVIGANTGVNNPYHTYRTYYKVSGETAHDTTLVAYNQMSYRKTGVSGVKLHNSDGQASFMYHPEDYTVWATQDPTTGLNLDGKVWLALYVAAPNENVKQVYSHPATNTPSGEISSIVTLADNLEKRVTATEAVNYYPVGTCTDYANKDYTFYTNEGVYENNYLYWFDENSKLLSVQRFNAAVKAAPIYSVNFNFNGGGATCNVPYSDTFADTTYVFGRPIVRPDDPFKCGNLFMDWRHGVDSFTVDSFKNIRAGIAEATGATVENQQFGIRSNMVINAAWKYFVTLHNPHDTAVVADYSLCEINTRDYVWEPTEATFPYVYEFHTDYLGKYYRDFIPGENANCNIRFDANAFTEIPAVLPVGQTSLLCWRVTDLCGYQITISQNVNVKFPPCGADNYNPHLYPFTPYVDSTYKAIDKDGNLYETVRMGCDCWTKENLKSLHYDDVEGSEIPVAVAYLNNEDKVDEYGRLYTWYSAVKLPGNSNVTVAPLNADGQPQGVCPSGWYLPSEEDFVRMSNLDNIQGASVGIKTDGSNNYWLGHEVGDNSTGFTAKPAGYYDATTNRYYNELGDTYFWSSSSTSTASAPCCALTHSCPSILIQDNSKWYGYSVRCIKYRKFDY